MILLGDCIEQMKTLPDNSIDAIVTDPPYGLSKEPDIAEVMKHWIAGDKYTHSSNGFMGKSWDSFVPGPEYWREVYRVLKPGGHALVFAGTRTVDLMMISLRFANFEIRDCLSWLYGSGFPKSHNLKGEWKGWGSALKPANEPIVLARKPLEKGLTLAENVLKWGTGGLNIDGSRIGTETRTNSKSAEAAKGSGKFGEYGVVETQLHNYGRWPANLLLDETAAQMLDEQSAGYGRSGGNKREKIITDENSDSNMFGTNSHIKPGVNSYSDKGSVSRFFKVIHSTEHAIQSPCKITSAPNAEQNLKITQEIEKVVREFFAQKSATPFLDLASHFLSVSDAEISSKNIETDFAQSLANLLAKTTAQLHQCLDYIVSRRELIPCLSLALSAALQENTGTIMTIQNQQKLSGCVSLVIVGIITSAKKEANLEFVPTRFLYQAKASKAERNAGLKGMPEKIVGSFDGNVDHEHGNRKIGAQPDKPTAKAQNFHPTVKPIKLMEYLCKLITPPGGTILDPFMGSGSTGVAVTRLGFNFIGCEMNAEYVAIAEKRIAHARGCDE